MFVVHLSLHVAMQNNTFYISVSPIPIPVPTHTSTTDNQTRQRTIRRIRWQSDPAQSDRKILNSSIL